MDFNAEKIKEIPRQIEKLKLLSVSKVFIQHIQIQGLSLDIKGRPHIVHTKYH